jgi:anti-anti-sigma factor
MRNPPINRMVVDVAAAPCQKAVFVHVTGDVDMAGEPELAGVVGHLAATGCGSVYIDSAGITFAGATLINLLVRLSARLPDHASMVLCRPDAMTRRMVELTSLDYVASVRADLPPNWMTTTAPTDEPAATLTIEAA